MIILPNRRKFFRVNYSYPSSTIAAYTSIESGTFSNGGSINILNSVYGNGSVTQSNVVNQPLYILSGGPNSLPCWRFDGNDRLNSSSMAINQPFTLAVACKRTGFLGDNRSPIGAANSFVGLVTTSVSASPLPLGLYAGIAASPTISINSNTWVIAIGVFNGSSSKLFVNNSSASTGNPGTLGISSAGYSIGSWLVESWVGDICAAGIFNSALSDSEVNSLRSYWNNIFGIY